MKIDFPVNWSNEDEYKSFALEPFLRDTLHIPWRSEVIEINRPFECYGGNYKIDYVIKVKDFPLLAIEAEDKEEEFDDGYEEVTFKAKNYREGLTTPLIMVAAGRKVELYEAKPSPTGIGIIFERMDKLLDWQELQEYARRFISKPTVVRESTTEQLKGIFREIWHALERIKSKERRFITLSQIIIRHMKEASAREFFVDLDLTQDEQKAIRQTLNRYDLHSEEGHRLAYSYHELIEELGIYKGESMTLPKRKGRKLKPRNLARYLTPEHVIDFMVKLAEPSAGDRVIDLACGSGGFLGGIIGSLADDKIRNDFAQNRLYAMDIDYLCSLTAETFVELLIPGKQEHLKIFQHNGLYSARVEDFEDDLSAEVQEGTFDLVIGNPPGNENYSGPKRHFDSVKRQLGLDVSRERYRDDVLFLHRALQLAKDDGKICLLFPDGFFTNTALEEIREKLAKNCTIQAIISIPRIFRDVSSKMAVIYLTKEPPPQNHKVFLAAVELNKEVNVESELNNIYEEYKGFA